ncbi:hypothetical protein [Sporosarcina sp.]|uniref:hypothetical protein n=1 Tax=Sporosarcina sp. TaxID=49982 RepID=UPI00261EDFA5|nr:hypothetical protein [Sporosarcina sp.]
MKVFLKKNKFVVLFGIAIFLLIPLAINFIVIFSQNIIPVVVDNDWIGFFGSYSGSFIGGIIGALIAIYVSKVQVNQQKVNFERDLKFRIEQQEENFNNQLIFWKQQQHEEATRVERENYKNQIYFLRRFEFEVIKIRNTLKKLKEQAIDYVFITDGTRYDAVSKEQKTNPLIWNRIDKLMDDEIKLRLQLLQEEYDKLIDIIGKSIWSTKDEIDLIKIEVKKLNNKKKRSETDEIHLKIHNIKIEELVAEQKYVISEKIYYWDTVYKGKYIEQAEISRKVVREEIIKSCKLNEMEVPEDPNQ